MIDGGSTGFSVCMWVQISSSLTNARASLFSTGYDGCYKSFMLMVDESNQLSFGFGCVGSSVIAGAPVVGSWFHACGVAQWDGSSGLLLAYHNTVVGNADQTFSAYQGSNVMRFGSAPFPYYALTPRHMQMDEVFVYSRAVTAGEVTTLYQFGSVSSGLVAHFNFEQTGPVYTNLVDAATPITLTYSTSSTSNPICAAGVVGVTHTMGHTEEERRRGSSNSSIF